MENLELKECPFCHSKNLGIGYNAVDERYYVVCRDCFMHGPERCGEKSRAVHAWNTLQRMPQWRDEPPTVIGWYYYMMKDGRVTIIYLPTENYAKNEWHEEGARWAGPVVFPF